MPQGIHLQNKSITDKFINKIKKKSSFVEKKQSSKKLQFKGYESYITFSHMIMPFKVEFDEKLLSESAIIENLLEWDKELSVDYHSKRKGHNYNNGT